MKPIDAIKDETRIQLIAELLMSQPWTLVACGLGEIKGEDLARRLLCNSTNSPNGGPK